MPDVTNYDGRLEQMAYYCEQMLDNIAKVNNVYHDSVSVGYAHALPGHLIKWKRMKQIGGRTLVRNQLQQDGDFSADDNSVYWNSQSASSTLSFADGVATVTFDGTYSVYNPAIAPKNFVSAVVGHKYLLTYDFYSDNSCYANVRSAGCGDKYSITVPASTWTHIAYLMEATGTGNVFDYLGTRSMNPSPTAGTTKISVKNVKIVDLTLKYGAGNEPTMVEEEQMFPASFYEHDEGSLLSAGVTQVISKDSSNNVLQTFSVPEEITTLEGYGWSCPDAYNYIDIANKKFVQAVGNRAYEAGDESDSSVITDGTNTHYELDEPLVFNVDLPDETITEVAAGGSITFENQHGDDYRIPVPADLEYIGL